MDICCPVVVFVFNHPRHLQTTLDALAANNLSENTDVTIICDGPRGPQDVALTTAVQQAAYGEKRFRSVTVQVNPENRGLATNIISGVTAMLEALGRVIVLEDDLATSPHFLTYMNDALNLYADDATVASIHGWCFTHAETDAELRPKSADVEHQGIWPDSSVLQTQAYLCRLIGQCLSARRNH